MIDPADIAPLSLYSACRVFKEPTMLPYKRTTESGEVEEVNTVRIGNNIYLSPAAFEALTRHLEKQ